MARCDVCGNEYHRAFRIDIGGSQYTFDCFECAIHHLAPTCARCECRVIGHGVEVNDEIYCCESCARLHRATA